MTVAIVVPEGDMDCPVEVVALASEVDVVVQLDKLQEHWTPNATQIAVPLASQV